MTIGCKNIHEWHVWRALCASHQHICTSTFRSGINMKPNTNKKQQQQNIQITHTNATNKPLLFCQLNIQTRKAHVSTCQRTCVADSLQDTYRQIKQHPYNNHSIFDTNWHRRARLWPKHTPTNKQTETETETATSIHILDSHKADRKMHIYITSFTFIRLLSR